MIPFMTVVAHHVCDRSFTVEVSQQSFLNGIYIYTDIQIYPQRQDTGLVSYTWSPSYVEKTHYDLFIGSTQKLMAFWDARIYKGIRWSLWWCATQCSVNTPLASLLKALSNRGPGSCLLPIHIMWDIALRISMLGMVRSAHKRVTARNSKPNQTSYRLPQLHVHMPRAGTSLT